MSSIDTTLNQAALPASIDRQNAYSPLLSGTQTRIIHIQRGSSHAIFEASLEVINLDLSNAPSYSAISYCCGDPSPVSDVYFTDTDARLGIGRNLTDALTRVLSDGISGPFWIDAICINQDDEEEKAQQVQMMTRVFKTADQVLAWLGRDDGTLQKAIQLLTRWADVYNDVDLSGEMLVQFANGVRDFTTADYELMRPLAEETGEEGWAILNTFFSRPFFRRSWIVQEVGVARAMQVLCGRIPSFDFVVLSSSAFWLLQHTIFRSLDVGQDLGLRTSAGECRRTYSLWNMRRHWQQAGAIPVALLRTAYLQESSDPRDRFLAIHGIFDLPANVKHHFKVDYKRAVWHVYAEAVRGIIKATRSIHILTITSDVPSGSNEFPFWVPRFDDEANHFGFDPDIDAWDFNQRTCHDIPHAAPNTEPCLKEEREDSRTLSLLGIRYPHSVVAAWSLCPKGWGQSHESQAYPWFKWPAAIVYMSLHKVPIPNSNKREVASAYAECTTMRYRCHRKFYQYSNDTHQIFADFRAYLRLWLDLATLEPTLKHMHEQVAALKTDVIVWDEEDAAQGQVIKGDSHRYYVAMFLGSSEKSLFMTQDWKIGVGPLQTQKDDAIVVFSGAARPFIIRKHDPAKTTEGDEVDKVDEARLSDEADRSHQLGKTQEQWQLVDRGVGWMQGPMNGEAWEGPGKEGEWFELV